MSENHSGHSPLPWVVDNQRDGYMGMVALFDADGRLVMGFGDMEDCEWRDICDAHTIARAVNAYAELVRACELHWYQNIETRRIEVFDGDCHVVFTAPHKRQRGAVEATEWMNAQRRAALALAKGLETAQ